MTAQVIALLIILPFVAAFIYAGIHEYLRYKSEGRATYGLVYDEETGTTHVTGIAEDEDAYDPEEFDPNDYNVYAVQNPTNEEREEEPEDQAPESVPDNDSETKKS
ncbi:hypothetical protein [Pseudosulfitobacter koreensis]|uniref:Uncharacterized protein n=1 Tax=Pseudosulfitobacter koreensis TaxID=2968472 RepID=A0ABT1YZZ7_9RHOB|nr:hypothetical protein [Pseudosulfitobacter koreense]MCR8826453.1 hypothetical protein [Pseudosulfitobacter koreense]